MADHPASRVPTVADREIVRALAARWAEIAALPLMKERKRGWRALHDLRPERPMILFETDTVYEYVAPDELRCQHPVLRAVEATMRENIRHFDEVGDDIVLEPYYRLGWDLLTSSWGVDVVQVPVEVAEGEIPLGYTFNFPIKTPADAALLEPRTFALDREATLARQRLLEDTFGDLLPVRVRNYDHFMVEQGAESWAGNYFIGLTWQLYRFIGNDGLLGWVYESPETIHELMQYMTLDREQMFSFVEAQGIDRAQHRQPAGGSTRLRLRLRPASGRRYRAGPPLGPVVLGRVTGVGADQPGDVCRVRAALLEATDRPLRPGLLRLLRAAAGPPGADHGGHAQPALGVGPTQCGLCEGGRDAGLPFRLFPQA